MRDPVPKQPWEVCMAYYDRLLRSVMELIEGAVQAMKVDEMSEAVEDLGRALLAIEDAWVALAVENSSSLVASGKREQVSENQVETVGDIE